MMAEHADTIVIGAGHAGLAVSYCLTQRQQPHVILERNRIGEAWRSGKWDSFTLVSPNWTLRLPGFPYRGGSPDGFLTRDEVVQYLEDYAHSFNAPVRTGLEVHRVSAGEGSFVVETNSGVLHADHVVIAVGAFQKPRLPSFHTQIAPHIHQRHSSQYRHPDDLPPGAVLVVGSGQSGCQITEELYRSGRKVYLCTGTAGRLPRRFRSRDIFEWADELGMLSRTADKLESPDRRFDANPQLTGRDGGKSLNLHQFAQDGVTLLGRLIGADGSVIAIAPDLMENLASMDGLESDFIHGVNSYIEQSGLALPDETIPGLRTGYDSPIITELDLKAAGITTILWATGYNYDYSWIEFPVFDERGYPLHDRGVTRQPGLYFIGLQFQHTAKSSLVMGVGEDAEYIVAHLAAEAVRSA